MHRHQRHQPHRLRGPALPGGRRHRGQAAGQLQLRPEPECSGQLLARALFQLRHHQRGGLRPNAGPRCRSDHSVGSAAVRCRHRAQRPRPRVRPDCESGVGIGQRDTEVLAGGRAPGRSDSGEPVRRDQCQQRGDITPHGVGVGQPDRHPVGVQSGRDRRAPSTPTPPKSKGASWHRQPFPAGSPSCATCPGPSPTAT